MKSICKKCAVFFMVVILTGNMTACWNYRELEQYALVAGIAIDRGVKYKYHLTIEVVGMGSGGKDEEIKPVLIETEGDTVFDAIRNTIENSAKRMFWQHCQAVIISQDIAKDGIKPVLDFFIRDQEPRLTLNPVISGENTAKEILLGTPMTSKITSYEINQSIETGIKAFGKIRPLELYQIVDSLEAKGVSLTMPVIQMVDSSGKPTTNLSGSAVFSEDKMIGKISNEETLFVNFVTDRIKGGLLVIKEKDEPVVTLEIYKNKTNIKTIYKNNKLSFAVNIKTRVQLCEQQTYANFLSKTGREKLKVVAQKQIEGEIEAIIKKVQLQYHEDIFGFGQEVNKHYPDLWKDIKDDWDEIFQKVKVQVTIDLDIKNSARAGVPIKEGQ